MFFIGLAIIIATLIGLFTFVTFIISDLDYHNWLYKVLNKKGNRDKIMDWCDNAYHIGLYILGSLLILGFVVMFILLGLAFIIV